MYLFEDLTPGEIWKIQDDIKFNRIKFNEGDSVMIFSKNKSGYPLLFKIGDMGIIKSVELNHVIVDFNPIKVGLTYKSSRIKLPKKLLVEKVYLRDLKLRKILGD